MTTHNISHEMMQEEIIEAMVGGAVFCSSVNFSQRELPGEVRQELRVMQPPSRV